jgi:curli production assembly/transport component CsgG
VGEARAEETLEPTISDARCPDQRRAPRLRHRPHLPGAGRGVENETHDELLELPAPASKIAVAVYAFEDETGQFETSETVQTLSRAVTQGATSILIEALLRTGNGTWFTVVEREGLDNLLRERQIIRETRAIYEGGGDLSRNYLPPLLFAGMMLGGGVIAYDTNTATGGLGARLLGIGGSTEFRQDTVTIYLRAISTQSGEVLESVNVSKTIFSVALSADVFRFVSEDEILEFDAGVTTNEPEHIGITQAIEKAVIALILEGTKDGRWAFDDPAAATALLDPGAKPSEPAAPVRPAAGEQPAPRQKPEPQRTAAAPAAPIEPETDEAAADALRTLIAEAGEHGRAAAALEEIRMEKEPGDAPWDEARRPG